MQRFKKHYTREEASALLPQIRQWLARLELLREQMEKSEKRVRSFMGEGHDVGGDQVNRWIRTVADMQEVLLEFQRREIMIKDIDRGLIDFPAIVGGREVFLCWEKDEEDIEFWHELDSGFAGRERLQ